MVNLSSFRRCSTSKPCTHPPTHDDERVGFVFLFWNGVGWRIIFELAPQDVDGDSQRDDQSWTLSHQVLNVRSSTRE